MGTTALRTDAWRTIAASAGVAGQRRQRRRQRWVMTTTLVASDAAMVAAALLLAWYLRIGSGLLFYNAPALLNVYLRTVAMAVAIILPIFAVNRLYDPGLLLGGTDEYSGVLRSCSFGMIVLILLAYWERGDALSRGWLLMSWALSVVLVTGSRFAWRRVFRRLQQARGWLTTPTLIVGANEHARAIARQLDGETTGVRIVGFVDDFLPAGTPVINGKQVFGPPRLLQELVHRHGIERVIVLPNAVAWETFQDIMRQMTSSKNFELQISPGFYEIVTTSMRVTQRGFVPLLEVERLRITGLEGWCKTGLDVVLGALLVLLTAPLLLAAAGVIWLFDGRPVLERHHVLGLNGRPFRTIKFRTGLQGTALRGLDAMPPAPGDGGSGSFRLRCFLYRTGLDKLPQLFDVLRGRMSLVGPRTISVGKESRHEPWLSNLLVVKPGWTGPWAVGRTGTTDALDAEMRLDLFYIRNWTFWMDLQILFQTAKKVVSRRSRSAW
jgi:lipopolysaccharide/colanic/teichoic acid biosynthesis glycosyltransferase